jgi:metal-responsive CopG/Arc/MetJ family transcriptional regulator
MKTAISVPDDVFNQAENVARQSGMSRSELYVTALRAYLDRTLDEQTTQQLDALYEYEVQEHDPFLQRAAHVLSRRRREK